jgi:hypothetical protein
MRIVTVIVPLVLAGTLATSLCAQVDFSAEWAPAYHEDAPERLPGPELGDYLGFPINEAARLRADSYDANRMSVVSQYQCRPHSADYAMRGLGNLRITREIDPQHGRLVAFHTYMSAWGSDRTIWMDGRAHPSGAGEHTFQGFSTGTWEGNMLTITTTHLKANYYRRNGVHSSDRRTLTEHWTRHGDILTVVTVVEDPVFLTEPLVRSQNWYVDPGQQMPMYYCEYVTEVTPATPDAVPNHLPGTNPFLTEVADWYGLPAAATRGGAETMYPEYQLKMGKPNSPPPEKCDRFCVCAELLECLANGPKPKAPAR